MQSQGNSIVIKLDDVSSTPVFIGERSRLSSATSVAFLDNGTIACAHFAARKIYAYRFDLDGGTHEKLSELDTTYNGIRCQTDLMAHDGHGRIAVTNFLAKTCTMYQYDGTGLRLAHYLPYDAGDVVHGIKFYSDALLAMTSRRNSSGIHFFEPDRRDPVYILRSDRNSVQDFCFISDRRLAVVSTTKSPGPNPKDMWDAHIDIVDFDLASRTDSIVESMEVKCAHLDNIVFYNSHLYASDQYNNAILQIDPESLQVVKRHEGFDFPHGLAVDNGRLAVSNYGSNTVEIRRL